MIKTSTNKGQQVSEDRGRSPRPVSLDKGRARLQRATNGHRYRLRFVVLPMALVKAIRLPSSPLNDEDHSSPDSGVKNDIEKRIYQRRGFGEAHSHGRHRNRDILEWQELRLHRDNAVGQPTEQRRADHGEHDLQKAKKSQLN